MKIGTIERGGYVDFERKQDGHLYLTLTKEGQKELEYYLTDDYIQNDDSEPKWRENVEEIFIRLIEDHLCNGWNWVTPESIGALTDAAIISDDIDYNDVGEVEHVGTVYAFMDYAIKLEIEELLFGRECRFISANEDEE